MKLPSRAYLRTKLSQPWPAKDAGTLHTIHDTVEYMSALPREARAAPHWQQAGRLILNEIAAVELTYQIQLAYSLTASWAWPASSRFPTHCKGGLEDTADSLSDWCEPPRLVVHTTIGVAD